MRRFLCFILVVLLPVAILAQESPLSSHYLLNPLSINPSYAGDASGLRASAYHYNQWTGIEGASVTNTLSIDAALKGEKIGLGLIVYTDKVGVTRENEIITDYSYRIGIGDGVLAFGLGAAINFFKTSYSELIAIDPGDDLYLLDSRTYISPNIRFGVNYSISGFYAGFSIPEFLTSKYDYNRGKQIISDRTFSGYNYLLSTGYKFEISDKFSLTPSTLLSYSSTPGFDYYANLEVGYNDIISLTLSYCDYKIVSGIIQFQVTNRFRIGYSYELDVSSMGRYNNGSHTIMLRYVLKNRVNAYNPLDF